MIKANQFKILTRFQTSVCGAILLFGPSKIVGSFLGFHARISDFFIICWIIPAVYARLTMHRPIYLRKGLIALIGFWVVGMLGFFVSTYPSGVMIALFRQFEILSVVMWVATIPASKAEIYLRMFGWYGVCFALVILYNIYFSHEGIDAILTKDTGVEWLRSNTAASMLIFLFFPTIINLFTNKYWIARIFCFMQISIMLGALICVNSIGALFSLFVCLTIMSYVLLKKSSIVFNRRYFISVALVISVAIFSLSNIVEKEINEPRWKTDYMINQTINKRLLIYQLSLKEFISSPIIGKGLNSLKDTKGLFAKYDYYYSHNWVLDFLAMTGMLGTLFILYALYYFMKKIYCAINLKQSDGLMMFGILLSILAILFHGLVEPNLTTNAFPIFFWFSIAVAAYNDKPELTFSNNRKLYIQKKIY